MNRLAGKTRIEVLSLLARPSGCVGVELGVAGGNFTRQLLASGAFSRLYGIDAYGDHRHDIDEYRAALRATRLDPCCTLLRMRFVEALSLFEDESLDFVHIDGWAHTGQDGGATIWAWASKVRLGGVFSGHDYHPDWPLTVRAVDCFVAETGFELQLADAEDDYPTWAVVKSATTPTGGPPADLLRAGRRAAAASRLRAAVAKPLRPLLRRAVRARR